MLTDARRDARTDGERLVLLADQDRRRWRWRDIDLGLDLVTEALGRSGDRPGPWVLRAGIAAADGLEAAPGDHRLLVLRAELHADLGRLDDACALMQRAIEAAGNDVERRHLRQRLDGWSVSPPA